MRQKKIQGYSKRSTVASVQSDMFMLGIIQHARSTLKNCEHHDSNLNLTVRSVVR